MPKLFVSGCSYSSYTGVDYPWGECLAPMLEYEYHHIAVGAGNNDRTWRIIARKVMDGEITPQDLVVIQYTDINRREFAASAETWEPLKTDSHTGPGRPVPWIFKQPTPFGDMYTTNYKVGSHSWVEPPHEQLHLQYETTAVDPAWEREHFATQHAMFTALCNQHDIRLIFLNSPYDTFDIMKESPPEQLYYQSEKTHFVNSFQVLWPSGARDQRDPYDLGTGPNTTTWDKSHLSQVGHIALAEGIFQYIQQNNV
jgi:hypothetical protein